jgi:hypothetical protein
MPELIVVSRIPNRAPNIAHTERKRMKPTPTLVNTEGDSMSTLFNSRNGICVASGVILLAATMMFVAGCGVVTVRHVPKFAVSSTKMSDLHGSQPIDLKAGECSSTEEEIGTVGMGKVVGRPSEWTGAAVEAVRINLSARGAVVTAGSPKALTITMAKAEVKAIPAIGVSVGKIVLTATTPEGLNRTFEGSSSSLAPLAAVDGAATDAVRKLLTDSVVDAYLRK